MGGYRADDALSHCGVGPEERDRVMHVRNYTDDPRLRPILEYLDPTLPDIERMLILAIAAGYTSKQFASLPGLSNRSRNREALRSLEQRGRIQWQRRKGWALVPGPQVERRHVERRIRTSKCVFRSNLTTRFAPS